MPTVPDVYDLVIGSSGYMFDRSQESGAALGYTPTFVPRTNTSADYSDDQQDFFFTASQRDWSLGEQQRFFGTDEVKSRKYWLGNNIDNSTQGQVKLRYGFLSGSTTEAVVTCAAGIKDATLGLMDSIVAVGATKLFQVAATGVATDKGAHGLGTAPDKAGLVSDGGDVYMSSTDAGSVGVRKWTGSAFSTFSATKVDALEFLNNTLFGLSTADATLYSYDTAGTATDLFTWQEVDGTARSTPGTFNYVSLKAFGGDLAILWSIGTGSAPGSELWFYNGTGVALAAVFPTNFQAYEMEVLDGILFISGIYLLAGSGGGVGVKPAILYYAGSEGLLWKGDTTITSTGPWMGHPALAIMDGGLVFNDDTTGKFMFYEPSTGSVSSIGTFTVAGDTPRLASCGRFALHTRDSTTTFVYPDTSLPSSGYIETSIFDFSATKTKVFRGVTVVFDQPTGTTVDISYRLNDVDGSYTSLQTGAVSGTEYLLSGVSGYGISIKVTLNLGSGSASPILKKIYVRAVPLLSQFRRGSYRIDCSGRDGRTPIVTNSGIAVARDGYAQLQELIAFATSTTPISITDSIGTYSGFIELDSFQALQFNPQEYIVTFQARAV